MSPTDLAELVKLPPGERAELAITLWESLADEERDAELELGPEQRNSIAVGQSTGPTRDPRFPGARFGGNLPTGRDL